ncbi:MAG TPA: pyridoxamine 5'-phosphate oxidase family protein [Actinophytocola sp.]|uniref:pyridoxamine 5'-phosphate oxidase family protein n=1 Tax=Actinophytocola sp. TaxID=1872138 RepID=UPI002DDD2DBB|nr:pyridoxamine 5'-phosphate oxidase family protein [Actinophytocola sp.]HEV2780411.1 pyridoxamine 5'-phosphate oxidase family protein [Actinophytocola sp.]
MDGGSEDSLADRTRRVLAEAGYLTIATVSADGTPWSAVLQYAWLPDPLRLLFGSAVQSRHSRHIAARPRVGGALFVTGESLTSVDGAQFTGRCAELTADEVRRFHATFYDAVLPDPQSRAQWTLPPAALLPPADHRLYLIEVERWWLVDTRTWAHDRIDRRIEMPLAELKVA